MLFCLFIRRSSSADVVRRRPSSSGRRPSSSVVVVRRLSVHTMNIKYYLGVEVIWFHNHFLAQEQLLSKKEL